MKKHILILLILTSIQISTLTAEHFPLFDTTRLIVRTKKPEILKNLSGIKKTTHFFNDLYVVTTTQIGRTEEALRNFPEITSIERNLISRAKLTSLPYFEPLLINTTFENSTSFNDPGISSNWFFRDAKENGISFEKAYKELQNQPSNPIVVAVVDTGVDYKHEDLKENMWINPNEIPSNSIDDDGNGYVDDIYGINTSERDANGNATNKVMDLHRHGTHVSGIIAAKQNNNKGSAGIASNVQIMALKSIPTSEDETDIDVAEAFLYAAKNGAKIINCSFGKRKNEGHSLIPDTVKHLADSYGVLVVVASGNNSENMDQFPIYPASHPNENIISIASSNSEGTLSSFSNFGAKGVDLAAPGDGIYSTLLNNKYGFLSGTSMATPVVSGVAAEIWSRFPSLTHSELKAILLESVTKSKTFKNKLLTEGRVDLFNAALKAKGL